MNTFHYSTEFLNVYKTVHNYTEHFKIHNFRTLYTTKRNYTQLYTAYNTLHLLKIQTLQKQNKTKKLTKRKTIVHKLYKLYTIAHDFTQLYTLIHNFCCTCLQHLTQFYTNFTQLYNTLQHFPTFFFTIIRNSLRHFSEIIHNSTQLY